MALTFADVRLWKDVAAAGLIPARPRLLELGAANAYGDVSLEEMFEPGPVPKIQQSALLLFDVARLFYHRFLAVGPCDIVSIDQDAIPWAMKHDLNLPWPGTADTLPFDVVINTGTGEHIFNQYQFFKTAHDHAAVGALMLHCLPLWGWLDHGFYNYHPTFVTDLAAANGYEIVRWAYVELAAKFMEYVTAPDDFHRLQSERATASAMQYALFRKVTDRPFESPWQGVYSERKTAEMERRWRERR